MSPISLATQDLHVAGIELNPSDYLFLYRAYKVLESNQSNERFTTTRFIDEMGISRTHLHRKLKRLTKQSTSEFIRAYRLNVAKRLIESQSGSITQIAREVGFKSPSYFTLCFKEKFGRVPTEITEGRSFLDEPSILDSVAE